jgi:hypothetical protein
MSKDDNKQKSAGTEDLERAKLEAELAKKRLTSTLSMLQERLRPGNLASEAWSGVRDKSGELADSTLQSVKERPVPVAGAVAAIVLFLARNPIMAAISRLFGPDNSDLVTTKVSKQDDNYDLATPAVSRSVNEGAIA